MITLAIIGGKLQGLEAAYLAKKAGFKVRLIDKSSSIPAIGMADSFFQVDLLKDELTAEIFKGVDLIIPALENKAVLDKLSCISADKSIPLAFDPRAYNLTFSKRKSDRFFASIGIPTPVPYPEARLPLVVKPSDESGSAGVKIISDRETFNNFILRNNRSLDQWVIQEYLQGPSFSIEIFGCGEEHFPLEVTDLEMDENYDCKRVLAPTVLNEKLQLELATIASKIASRLELRGIMDVEVINHEGSLKVLEIDARLPSQTPTAVLHASGINMVELLVEYYLYRQRPSLRKLRRKAVIFEHILVSADQITVSGEQAIAEAGPLQHFHNFFGADEALSNYRPGWPEWLATLIICAADHDAAAAKRNRIIKLLMSEMNIKKYFDPLPEGSGVLYGGLSYDEA